MSKSMKKIAVIGTHGVGKTTLCQCIRTYLVKKGYTVAMVSELVRDCPLPIHEEQDVYTTQWLIGRQLSAEMEARVDDPDYIICDRSIVDPMIYLLFNKPSAISGKIYDFIFEYLNSYNYIFLIRPKARKISSDEFRSEDENYQCLIHSLFTASMFGKADLVESQEIFDSRPIDGLLGLEFEDDSLIERLLEK